MENSCGYCCTKISNISVKRGSKQILKNVNIHIHCGKLTVIIGKNGAGKSTLLKAILGEIPHEGSITFKNKNNEEKKIKIGYVPQKLDLEIRLSQYMTWLQAFLQTSLHFYLKVKSYMKK